MPKRVKLAEKEARMQNCPYCGEPFDPEEYEVIECPQCGKEGSTKCCLAAGRGCLCIECEEGA